MARFGVLSFNGNKIITTSGGGMLVGNDPALIAKAKFYATQAKENLPYYEHKEIGYNYRMSNIIAAIGRGQLAVIEERVRRKREIYEIYKKELGGISGIIFAPEYADTRSNCWLTCITIDKKKTGADVEQVRLALEQENIESRPLWKPMHLQPVFAASPAYVNGTSEKLFNEGLCLPSGTGMSEEDLNRVLGAVSRQFSP
ncbi:MAG: DegT/DnrJ/EryC1/StrS family aminotransferase [Chitinispirillaceae bacterium]|nr:DegT/DnrJ/EryC1/StrS family aminotransferase [Chitinispirillaceae bacterium]